jgi:uncharacterized membrane protein YfcA
MRKQTLRGYVWAFCLYLALAISAITRHGAQIRPPHFERSFFYALFPGVIGPAIVMAMCLGLLAEFKDPITKAAITFTAASFAFSAVFSLHQYEYISFATPHWLSTCSWLVATVLLGYRIDQLLKTGNKEVELN